MAFFIYAIVNSFTPGPNNFMAMSFGNRYGLKRTISFCIGVSIGFFTIVLLSSVFNRILVEILPTIQLPLTIFGVIYMLYLAYVIVFSKKTKAHNKEEEAKSNLFFIGIIMQFVNPKAILYGITIVGIFILPFYDSNIAYFLFSLLLGLIGLVSAITWALFGSVLQRMITKYGRSFNIVMGLLLVYSAIAIAIQ